MTILHTYLMCLYKYEQNLNRISCFTGGNEIHFFLSGWVLAGPPASGRWEEGLLPLRILNRDYVMSLCVISESNPMHTGADTGYSQTWATPIHEAGRYSNSLWAPGCG